MKLLLQVTTTSHKSILMRALNINIRQGCCVNLRICCFHTQFNYILRRLYTSLFVLLVPIATDPESGINADKTAQLCTHNVQHSAPLRPLSGGGWCQPNLGQIPHWRTEAAHWGGFPERLLPCEALGNFSKILRSLDIKTIDNTLLEMRCCNHSALKYLNYF